MSCPFHMEFDVHRECEMKNIPSYLSFSRTEQFFSSKSATSIGWIQILTFLMNLPQMSSKFQAAVPRVTTYKTFHRTSGTHCILIFYNESLAAELGSCVRVFSSRFLHKANWICFLFCKMFSSMYVLEEKASCSLNM